MKSLVPKLFATVFLTACGGSFRVEPVTVQPIHITVDVNLRDRPAEPIKR